MSRNARTRTPRGRRIALSAGALIAASISMGNAPAARADVIGADQVSDLIGAFDPHALSAAGVSDTLALSFLIEAFDPNSFSSSGAPTDALGLLGYYTDTYLLGPTGLDAELAPLVQELVGTVSSVPPPVEQDAISALVGALDPNAFSPTGVPVDPLGLLAYYTDNYLLALDPSAFSAGLADLTAPTAAGLLDPVIDGLLNSGLSLF